MGRPSRNCLVEAVRKVGFGAGCQRCRVHFLRNTFAVIPKDSGELVARDVPLTRRTPDRRVRRRQGGNVTPHIGPTLVGGRSRAFHHHLSAPRRRHARRGGPAQRLRRRLGR
ncbi:transposase [Streptomyces albireticuli]|uniref:transposase n=1 Tax=Streptomyces albireticuli TaxID=1940 RepID=UPI000D1BD49B